MKLRLGQPVHATDGVFGEVADIVIDPIARTVTHLVIEPHHNHQQGRLVSIELVHVGADAVEVALDLAHIHQLQRVAQHDFVKLGERIEVGPDWDVGTEDVVSLPYWSGDFGLSGVTPDDLVEVSYDAIPKGECEIRRRSVVRTSDGHIVGHVEGFLAHLDHLVAVLVEPKRPFLSHHVVVAMSSVTKVRNDEVRLGIDRAAFKKLPTSGGLSGPFAQSPRDRIEAAVAGVVHRLRAGTRHLLDRARFEAEPGDDVTPAAFTRRR
jgi:uncharacterized protein YrrD